ncbi:MAG: HNH endonuclease [Candidatus Thiocaldithrix dubininis]|uniref:HNH endonuclease n=1 Tax=Candidatus Thiocaldithrix dubininis TaxID=3080823 RepID=A0AA95KEH3_9GAMM|nr:MAG: HNH endonuclease [Candidatus Thiocaldithrix dubininis]
MAICYLTGKTITEKDHPNKDDHKSLEHIIPNALGGKIASNYVLTFRANQQLNEEIDKEFTKIFTAFVARLPINKDRNSTPSVSAFHPEYQTDVFFKNGRFFPKKPFFDDEKRIIYADSEKNGKNYRAYLEREGKVSKGETIRIMDDLAGDIEIPFQLGNVIFKKGFAKIAAGFATLKGVSRNNLSDVIDLTSNKIKDKIILSPFIPNASELLFESNKYKSINYPVHSLVLVGSKSQQFLYCYVDLFSAFQFYVLLSQDYAGNDIYEAYTYDILNDKEINHNDYIKSIPNVPASLVDEKYRVISPIDFIKNTHRADETRIYCHDNFYKLASFVNYTFINQKAKKLKLI